jgi:hypothetical protein
VLPGGGTRVRTEDTTHHPLVLQRNLVDGDLLHVGLDRSRGSFRSETTNLGEHGAAQTNQRRIASQKNSRGDVLSPLLLLESFFLLSLSLLPGPGTHAPVTAMSGSNGIARVMRVSWCVLLGQRACVCFGLCDSDLRIDYWQLSGCLFTSYFNRNCINLDACSL